MGGYWLFLLFKK